MEIDLVRLCSSVGARLITDPVASIDHQKREVLFDRRPAIPFDVLSIGIGSVPSTGRLQVGIDRIIKIKPMQSFLHRLRVAIHDVQRESRDRELKVVVVGGGVAGTEITFCLPPFLQRSGSENHAIHLVTHGECVLPEVSDRTREEGLSGISTSRRCHHDRPVGDRGRGWDHHA